jgi:hypothetical protein
MQNMQAIEKAPQPRRAGRREAMIRRHPRLLFFFFLILGGCSPIRGCAESRFSLAQDSRLPKWTALPSGFQRSDVELEMTYYSSLFDNVGRTATFVLRDRSGHKLAEAIGKVEGNEPHSLKPHSDTGELPYPLYDVITVNGVTDVIEHRERLGPVFYITDDPEVRRKLHLVQ